jgi:beta-hydroxyacyl-ACP dehydratase FabZ
MTAAISVEQILGILPHRYPFLLIDRVRELTQERIVAVKNVSFGEPYFQGHFPGHPIMPGVLQIEAMAQAGGILAAHVGDFDPATQVVYFMAIDNVKFRRPVVPGDQLVLEVEPVRRGRVWKLRGIAKVDDEVASQGELLATIAPRERVNLDSGRA